MQTLLLTALAMLAFAGNSLLCRLALTTTGIDPATFTSVRLLSGALVLALLVALRHGSVARGGSWVSAFALFAYAAGFSYAYLSLGAATGALLLFGAVQLTMIAYALAAGERLSAAELAGLLVAVAGLIGLLLPGLHAPPLAGAILMLAAGVAWGVYSLRGRRAGDPARDTAGNFLRATLFTLCLSAASLGHASMDLAGLAYAIASGALASGLGYAIWYAALPSLSAATAATVQLSVPAIAALCAVPLLGERLSPRLLLAAAAILGGVALFIQARHRRSLP